MTSEEYLQLYKKLPLDLKDSLDSKETWGNIFDICKRNDVEDKHQQIAEYVCDVLLGILPPNEFREKLIKELKIEPEIEKKVFREIFRYILFPVKRSLAELYKMEIALPGAMPEAAPEEKEKAEGEDIYREPIE